MLYNKKVTAVKVGMMVELSAYGLKLRMFEPLRGQVGIIMKIEKNTASVSLYRYTVRWTNTDDKTVDHFRKDLKILRYD